MKPHHVILEGFSVNFKSGLLVSSSRRIENKHSFGEQVGFAAKARVDGPPKNRRDIMALLKVQSETPLQSMSRDSFVARRGYQPLTEGD
jgi:hypothetical protein